MVIDSAMKKDDGTYMCVAENPAGLRRAVAAVRVKGQHARSVHHVGTVAPRVQYTATNDPLVFFADSSAAFH